MKIIGGTKRTPWIVRAPVEYEMKRRQRAMCRARPDPNYWITTSAITKVNLAMSEEEGALE